MNPFVKIISGLIVFVNRLIDNLDKRTIETIKQSFYLLVFIGVIIGIVFGYQLGKGAAKKYGAPLAEYTDNVFEVIVKKERENVSFNTMVEAKSIMEKEKTLAKKSKPIVGQKLDHEYKKSIIEPDIEARKITPLPRHESRDRIAEIDRLDVPLVKDEVKELDTGPSESIDKKSAEVLQRKDEELLIKRLDGTGSSETSKPKVILRESSVIQPEQDNSRIIEK